MIIPISSNRVTVIPNGRNFCFLVCVVVTLFTKLFVVVWYLTYHYLLCFCSGKIFGMNAADILDDEELSTATKLFNYLTEINIH